MAVPKQKPGKSCQTYATPWTFIEKVYGLLGITEFAHDFAADELNSKGITHWDEAYDSLTETAVNWAAACQGGWGWLNPPFSHIAPWAKCCRDAKVEGASIAFLVPAAVGSNWYRDYVNGEAFVWALNGRIAFDPEHPTWGYPKDCILCLYSPDFEPGFDVWSWQA